MIERFSTWLVRHKSPLLIGTVIAAVIFPYVFTSRYVLRIAILCLMYCMLAVSLNLMSGILGQISFGHAAFWGIGAYTAAILAKNHGWNNVGVLIVAALVAGLFGLLLSLPVMHLKGYYFTITTMVFCQIVRVIEINWMSLTNGPLGIMAIPKLQIFGQLIKSQQAYYYLILILLSLTTFIVHKVIHARMGYAILAVRDDDLAAGAMGIHVFKYKVLAIVISSMLAGAAGGFYSVYTSYIDPGSFTNAVSNNMLVMVIFGGLGNIFGSFVGATLLTVLPEVLRGFSEYRQLVFGALLVLLMLVRPEGIFGSVNFKYIGQRLSLEKSIAGGKHHE
ncbi:branched-chain amino acid ABC transporter permease [Parasphaerochaeta coccoides]|uniref:Inner-membrane translocator n=1 Tax=Parasphaerochaeta coccoides (strain ATCC BAA-1237 / DSM 17374 / SPN1) TaxID=760011 RepID=F4GJ56_PARC1|nr:branched-chain amino acid ABC transporter permease [Parasphaerochaeta coccoides]AEC01351.1 inner-membrane translocator [Parasphaerochaeta coccoides DSM 17374]